MERITRLVKYLDCQSKNDEDHPSYLSEVSYEILSKQTNVEFQLDDVHDQMYHK